MSDTGEAWTATVPGAGSQGRELVGGDVAERRAAGQGGGVHRLVGGQVRAVGQPALRVAADPRRAVQLAQPVDRLGGPGAEGGHVAAEQPGVRAALARVAEDRLERG